MQSFSSNMLSAILNGFRPGLILRIAVIIALTVTLHTLSVYTPISALAGKAIADKYPGSQLYDKPQKVIKGVWSAIGQTSPGSFENGGHNNNLTLIVTGKGAVVINCGSSPSP